MHMSWEEEKFQILPTNGKNTTQRLTNAFLRETTEQQANNYYEGENNSSSHVEGSK